MTSILPGWVINVEDSKSAAFPPPFVSEHYDIKDTACYLQIHQKSQMWQNK